MFKHSRHLSNLVFGIVIKNRLVKLVVYRCSEWLAVAILNVTQHFHCWVWLLLKLTVILVSLTKTCRINTENDLCCASSHFEKTSTFYTWPSKYLIHCAVACSLTPFSILTHILFHLPWTRLWIFFLNCYLKSFLF